MISKELIQPSNLNLKNYKFLKSYRYYVKKSSLVAGKKVGGLIDHYNSLCNDDNAKSKPPKPAHQPIEKARRKVHTAKKV